VRKLARGGVASKRSITHAILGLFQEAYKPDFHIYRAILESFFYAYSAIVDSFVTVSFFLEKHYIPQSTLGSIIVDQHATFVSDYANVLVKGLLFLV